MPAHFSLETRTSPLGCHPSSQSSQTPFEMGLIACQLYTLFLRRDLLAIWWRTFFFSRQFAGFVRCLACLLVHRALLSVSLRLNPKFIK